MTTDVYHFGASQVTVTDKGATAAEKRLKAMPKHWIVAGLFGRAYNRYGERIATYGFTQAGSRGSAPNWVTRARVRCDALMPSLSPALAEAAVMGSPPMEHVLNHMGEAIRREFQKQVEAEDLYETGDLAGAITFATPTHFGDPPQPPRIYRMKRAGGAAALSARQQFYQLYHKGRSRSMTRMRRAVTYREFEKKYAATYLMKTTKERATVKRTMAEERARAQRVAASTVPGRWNNSQAQMVRDLIMGTRVVKEFSPKSATARFGRGESTARSRRR